MSILDLILILLSCAIGGMLAGFICFKFVDDSINEKMQGVEVMFIPEEDCPIEEPVEPVEEDTEIKVAETEDSGEQ
jgi:hypothetical protein